MQAMQSSCFRIYYGTIQMVELNECANYQFHRKRYTQTIIIVCKLDYCNSLYYGISDFLIHQLQLIQNAAAKAIVGLYKHDHLGDTLKELHWLPISYRIKFKVILLVYKCLNGMGPDYLSSMFNFASTTHTIHLAEPRIYSQYGERSFQRAGPKLWNGLPLDLKTCSSLESFKVALKTFLFKQAFDVESLT